MNKKTKDFIKQLKEQREEDKKSGFSEFYQENLPISDNLSLSLINKSIQGSKVGDIEMLFDLGDEISIWLNDEKLVLTIDGNWELFEQKKSLLSSEAKDDNTELLLKDKLNEREVKEVNYDKDRLEATIQFDNELLLVISSSKNKPEILNFIDREKSFVVSLDNEGIFSHTVNCPESLYEKYLFNEKGRVVANILYSLDFYKNLIK